MTNGQTQSWVNHKQPPPPEVDEDIALDIPEKTAPDWTIIPSGSYTVTLVRVKTVDKPAWRIQTQQEAEDAKPEDKRKEIDVKQHQWIYELVWRGTDDETGEDFEETITLSRWNNRTFHESSTNAKDACALLGLQLSEWDGMRDRGFTVKKDLIGKQATAFVVEKAKENGDVFNKIDKLVPLPKARTKKPTPAATLPQSTPDEEMEAWAVEEEPTPVQAARRG